MRKEKKRRNSPQRKQRRKEKRESACLTMTGNLPCRSPVLPTKNLSMTSRSGSSTIPGPPLDDSFTASFASRSLRLRTVSTGDEGTGRYSVRGTSVLDRAASVAVRAGGCCAADSEGGGNGGVENESEGEVERGVVASTAEGREPVEEIETDDEEEAVIASSRPCVPAVGGVDALSMDPPSPPS